MIGKKVDDVPFTGFAAVYHINNQNYVKKSRKMKFISKTSIPCDPFACTNPLKVSWIRGKGTGKEPELVELHEYQFLVHKTTACLLFSHRIPFAKSPASS